MFHHFGPPRAREISTKISYFMKRFRFKNVLCREFGTLIKVQKTLRCLMFSRLRAFFWHRKIGYFRSPALLRESWKKCLLGVCAAAPGSSKTAKNIQFLIDLGKASANGAVPKGIEKYSICRYVFYSFLGLRLSLQSPGSASHATPVEGNACFKKGIVGAF